ncbi:MAG: hypothetical protein OES38_08090 [Gammaproteobacteria bacterium]|nr:hypothetical protein [Gammaproteobacteria bacterium]
MNTERARSAQSKSRMHLMLILVVAAASLGGSYLVFFSARDGGGWGTTNHGQFVAPARILGDFDIRAASEPLANETGTWWLWVLTTAECGGECERALHQLRQLHILLNKDANRVRRALVTDGGHQQPHPDYPELLRLTGSLEGLATGIYIVDPIGNLVLFYPLADAGAPVLEDLKRLLKVSQIG